MTTPDNVRHASLFGGELDLPEARAAHQPEPFRKHMHPAIRIHPTISLLSEAWGYITEVKPPGIGPWDKVLPPREEMYNIQL